MMESAITGLTGVENVTEEILLMPTMMGFAITLPMAEMGGVLVVELENATKMVRVSDTGMVRNRFVLF
jgi:hypothetical protein